MRKDVECPYCGKDIEICHDDGFGCEEDHQYEYECPECEKNFIFYTNISIDHFAEKADCLNDGKHDYKKTNTFPPEYATMRCTVCHEEKP